MSSPICIINLFNSPASLAPSTPLPINILNVVILTWIDSLSNRGNNCAATDIFFSSVDFSSSPSIRSFSSNIPNMSFLSNASNNRIIRGPLSEGSMASCPAACISCIIWAENSTD